MIVLWIGWRPRGPGSRRHRRRGRSAGSSRAASWRARASTSPCFEQAPTGRRQDARGSRSAGWRSTPGRPSSRCAVCSTRSFAAAGRPVADARRTGARQRCWRATPGATASGSTCSPMSSARPTRSATSPARARPTAIAPSARRARRVFETLDRPFIRAARPSLLGLVGGAGLAGLGDLLADLAVRHAVAALGAHFRDPRLRQLFGRYATYCGSSPFRRRRR